MVENRPYQRRATSSQLYAPRSADAFVITQVHTSPVEELANAFKSFKLASEIRSHPERTEASFEAALSIAYSLRYSVADLEDFSRALAEFQHEADFSQRAGLFLSALVIEGFHDSYRIDTTHLLTRLDYLAKCCSKPLAVEGDVGNFFGEDAEGADLAVSGNAGDYLARKAKADFRVCGDVGKYAGLYFQAGHLRIMGNAGFGLGSHMGVLNTTYQFGDSYPTTIVVDGSAGDNPGEFAKCGMIKIKLDAGDNVGFKKTGGDIYVNGQAKSVCRTQTSVAIKDISEAAE